MNPSKGKKPFRPDQPSHPVWRFIMAKKIDTTTFNAEMQARYEAIVSKYMHRFEESKALNKEAAQIMKPYKGKNALPMTGEAFYNAHNTATRLQAKARKIYKDTQLRVSDEFWSM